MGSLQAIVGLNVVVVAFMFLQQWLSVNSYYHEFMLEPEQAGITVQYLLTRAGISFAALAVVILPASILIHVRETRRKRGRTWADLLWLTAIILLTCTGIALSVYNGYNGLLISTEGLLYASVFFIGPLAVAYLLITGLKRNVARRFHGGLVLLLILAISLLPGAHLQGQIEGQTVYEAVRTGEFTSRFDIVFGVPSRNHILVRHGTTPKEVADSECDLLLGSSAGTTYVFGARLVFEDLALVRVVWETTGLPTDSTIIETCRQ